MVLHGEETRNRGVSNKQVSLVPGHTPLEGVLSRTEVEERARKTASELNSNGYEGGKILAKFCMSKIDRIFVSRNFYVAGPREKVMRLASSGEQ